MSRIRKRQGFTLAELLIVVAIIAVLVAISIPIFASRLEKAREATDISNMRAARAAAVSAYIGEETIGSNTLGSGQGGEVIVYYNATDGRLVADADAIPGKQGERYGKGTAADGGTDEYMGYKATDPVQGGYLRVAIQEDGTVTMKWIGMAQ